jgi:hypothetical protein
VKGTDHQLSAYAEATKEVRGYLVTVLRRASMAVRFFQMGTKPVAQIDVSLSESIEWRLRHWRRSPANPDAVP